MRHNFSYITWKLWWTNTELKSMPASFWMMLLISVPCVSCACAFHTSVQCRSPGGSTVGAKLDFSKTLVFHLTVLKALALCKNLSRSKGKLWVRGLWGYYGMRWVRKEGKAFADNQNVESFISVTSALCCSKANIHWHLRGNENFSVKIKQTSVLFNVSWTLQGWLKTSLVLLIPMS